MFRSRLGIVSMVLLGAVLIAFFAMLALAPTAQPDLSREKPSAGGLYQVAIAPEKEPIEQGVLHNWVVTVRTASGAPVSDATVTVDGGMPEHGHGLPTTPQATGHMGEGRYRIEGVRFNMSGNWVLKVGITAPAGTDSAEFNLSI